MNVFFSSRKVNPWRVPGSHILGWCWRVDFASAGDDNCKNTGRRRWLRCGINLANGRFCREKRYSSDHAGKQYSVGRGMLCWIVDNNLLGMSLLFEVLMDFAGDTKASLTTLFPWLLAEDNPVISYWGNNSLNKAGRRVRALRGISFQNLLGISLLLGEMDSNFPGEPDWTLLGKFWIVSGKWFHWMLDIPSGNKL